MNDQTALTNLPHNEAPPLSVTKAGMTPGGAIAALVPQTLDDAFRLSKALAASGDMVPKHFQAKPEMIMAAIIRGMEVGLAPMQALSNIAVINGRASIWGDALPALLQRAGHTLDCVIEGEGDARQAIATVTRGDTAKEIVRTFSVADAKRANLWNKQGPWQAYPDRMLMMRARSFACRDGAADALMGLQVAEEVQDYPKDVTPKESPLAAKVAAARTKADPVPDADVVQDQTPPHWTAGLDYSSAFPGSPAWDQGVEAFQTGQEMTDCPFDGDRDKAIDWMGGFDRARRTAE